MEYVGSKNSYEHWSERWEENVAGLLAYQNTVQAEIDECLRDGDLIGAGFERRLFVGIHTHYIAGT